MTTINSNNSNENHNTDEINEDKQNKQWPVPVLLCRFILCVITLLLRGALSVDAPEFSLEEPLPIEHGACRPFALAAAAARLHAEKRPKRPPANKGRHRIELPQNLSLATLISVSPKSGTARAKPMSETMSGGQHDQETERNYDKGNGRTRAEFFPVQRSLPLERFADRRWGKELPQDDRVGEEIDKIFQPAHQAQGIICFQKGNDTGMDQVGSTIACSLVICDSTSIVVAIIYPVSKRLPGCQSFFLCENL
jgi:hypothetical protein